MEAASFNKESFLAFRISLLRKNQASLGALPSVHIYALLKMADHTKLASDHDWICTRFYRVLHFSIVKELLEKGKRSDVFGVRPVLGFRLTICKSCNVFVVDL